MTLEALGASREPLPITIPGSNPIAVRIRTDPQLNPWEGTQRRPGPFKCLVPPGALAPARKPT
jgi:hypothetical protein